VELFFDVVPNPASEYIRVTVPTGTSPGTKIFIYNALGQISKTIFSNVGDINIDIADLSNGLYYVEVNYGEERKLVKIVKSK